GGSNAIGAFARFVDEDTALIGVEPGGHGIPSGKHGATLGAGRAGCLHGSISFVLQDTHGQIHEAHSISAGLDYPGVGPEHAHLMTSGRAEYISATDDEALDAFAWLSQLEGIIPALESAHAVAEAIKRAPTMPKDSILLINLSGRGDKDLDTVIHALEER
ncbi:MAG: pyridoxal-phosphate dependent enzyme, partial [Anaerolineae bacterium]|nr:pyridoxal-phosphate dependent enzyme [Anaerolineae bacterium]